MTPVFRTEIASIALTLLVTASAALADMGGPPSFGLASDANYIAAKKAADAKDWNKAVYYLKYVKSDDADVYNLRGYSFRHLGNFDEAFSNYKLALQIDPNHRGAHEYVGEAYLLTSNPAMAEQHLAALDRICGKGCEEYRDLAREIAEYKKKH